MIGWMGIQTLTFPKRQTSDIIIYLVIMFPFTCIGIWMQMTGWIEKIDLDRNGIMWLDWKGEVHVRATLDQIRKVTSLHRRERDAFWKPSALEIDTDLGVIEASGSLRGRRKLESEIKMVIESRKIR